MADPTTDITTEASAPVMPTTAAATQPTGNALRSVILGNKALKEEPLYIPEWGVTVTIREMKATTRVDVLDASNDPRTGKRDGKKFYPLIAIASCFDPATGLAIFEPTDMGELNEGGGTAMERVCQVAMRLSGLDPSQFTTTKNA